MTNVKNKKQVDTVKRVKRNKRKSRKKLSQGVGPRMPGSYARVLTQRNSTNALALAISNPAENDAVRFPTSDMARTSVAAFKYQHELTTADSGAFVTPLQGFPNNSAIVALFGQPALTHSIFGAMSLESTSSRRFRYNDGGLIKTSWAPVDQLSGTVLGVGNHTLNDRADFAYMVNAAGVVPVGGDDYVPIGEIDGQSYVFFNKGDTMVALPALPLGGLFNGSVDIIVYEHVASTGEEVSVKEIPVPIAAGVLAPTILFTAIRSGFYGFYAAGLVVDAPCTYLEINLELQRSSTAFGWTHKPCFDLYSVANGDPEIGKQVRCNATSILVTNTTAPISRAGTVLAGRLMGQDIYNLSYSALQRCAEKYSGQAATGMYTFMEFTKPREEFMRACEGSSLALPRVQLGRSDFVHFAVLTAPTGVTNTYTVTLATHVEFKTDVSRYLKGVSCYGFSELLHARALINSNPEWFYENPTHMAKIYQFLQRGLKSMQQHAGPISGLASSIDPARAPLYALLAQLMGK